MSSLYLTPEECVSSVAQAVKTKLKNKRTTSESPITLQIGHVEGVLAEINGLVECLATEKVRNSVDITGIPRSHQTKFSGDLGTADTGNCFQVCIATVMGLPVEQVPHFYGDRYIGIDEANREIAEFLGNFGYQMAYYPTEVIDSGIASGWFYTGTEEERVVVIVTGQSPRGDWKHAVVGYMDPTSPNNWTLLHDPHPSGAGILTTEGFEIISKTVRIKV